MENVKKKAVKPAPAPAPKEKETIPPEIQDQLTTDRNEKAYQDYEKRRRQEGIHKSWSDSY